MNGWLIFFIISLVLGIIVSNLLLLKQSAKIKIADDILKSIAEKRAKEIQEQETKQQQKNEVENKKPTDD